MLKNFLLSIFFSKDPVLVEIEKMTPAGFLLRAEVSKIDSALFCYRSPLVKTLIWNIKFRKNVRCIELASQIMYEHLLTLNIQDPLIIPVPLSPKRKRERGYNQTELITKGFLGLEVTTDCITRKNTPPQTSLPRQERIHNLKNTFTVSRPEKIIGRNIIIIDDVITTGATTKEMTRVLKTAGAKIIIVKAFAH
jgi:ComF family protein